MTYHVIEKQAISHEAKKRSWDYCLSESICKILQIRKCLVHSGRNCRSTKIWSYI